MTEDEIAMTDMKQTWDDLDPREIEGVLMEHEGWWYYHEGTGEVEDFSELFLGSYPEVLETKGGGEGSGSEMYVVIKLGSRIFKKSGYYASWDGSKWDGSFKEVKPVQKTITVWEERS